jgi:hypothetical protein
MSVEMPEGYWFASRLVNTASADLDRANDLCHVDPPCAKCRRRGDSLITAIAKMEEKWAEAGML